MPPRNERTKKVAALLADAPRHMAGTATPRPVDDPKVYLAKHKPGFPCGAKAGRTGDGWKGCALCPVCYPEAPQQGPAASDPVEADA
jgi:hypothetical protein